MIEFDFVLVNLESNMASWIVFEYMGLGDLAQLLRSANDVLENNSAEFLKDQVIAYQIEME